MSHLVDSAADIDPAWLGGGASVGLTAGASTPEYVVQDALSRIAALGPVRVREHVLAEENLHFGLPRIEKAHA